jgi:TPR repeat protein
VEPAEVMHGERLLAGNGVPKDPALAEQFLRRAATAGTGWEMLRPGT